MELRAVVTTKGAIFDGKAPEIINEQLTAAMYEATAFLERKVKARTPQGIGGAKGGLMSTIQAEVQGKGTPMVKGIVTHQSVYGDVVEKGRTAGKAMPPEGTLIRWMMLKMGLDEKQAQRIEFVVRRKIGKKGFPGAFMFEKTFTENLPKVDEIFGKYGFTIAEQLNV